MKNGDGRVEIVVSGAFGLWKLFPYLRPKKNRLNFSWENKEHLRKSMVFMFFPQHNVEGLLNSCPRVGGYLLGWACNRKNYWLLLFPSPGGQNLFGHGHGRNRGHGRRNRHHRQRRNGRRR